MDDGSYLTPDERTMMMEKQRKLKRDVAATSIATAIRAFLARKRYEKSRAAIAEAEAKYGKGSGADAQRRMRSFAAMAAAMERGPRRRSVSVDPEMGKGEPPSSPLNPENLRPLGYSL